MVFTQKAMLYLGLILDESLLDKQLVWLWRKCRFDCAHCGFFQSHALGLLCFHPVHLPEVPWCVREGNLVFPETAHLPETQEISACSVSLFFLSFSWRGKGRGCFWRFDWGFYALQRQPVVQMILWKRRVFVAPHCIMCVIWPHRFKDMKLEAVAVMRIQSPIANGLRI